MGTTDKHKVCFEVLGVPVIIRALETYNLCGSTANVVVVGAMAESVMATVSQRFPGTPYAFQDKALGTGDAARKGAEILEQMRFDGNVLVVAGDKVIDSRVVRQLLAMHEQSGADVTLATAKRPPNSSAGILLKSPRDHIVGILEEAERRRLVALAKINALLLQETILPRAKVEGILMEQCGEKTARAVTTELWGEERLKAKGQSLKSARNGSCPISDSLAEGQLTREAFEGRFSKEERLGWVKVGEEAVWASQMLARFDQMNMSTYLFRAPVLYDALSRLRSARPNHEEYLTDVFQILAQRKKPARIIGCEVQDLRDLMAFNNPQELLAIEGVYRQRQGQAVAVAPAVHAETLGPASAWDDLLRNPGPAGAHVFKPRSPGRGVRGSRGGVVRVVGNGARPMLPPSAEGE